MKIREIERTDTQEIIAWANNSESVKNTSYKKITVENVLEFFEEYNEKKTEKHFVIANEENEYEGMVSLWQIRGDIAEMSIVVKKEAMGKGYAWFGIVELLKYAFETVGLERVYWCVPEKNLRAIRFFKKHGFNTLDADVPREILERYSGNEEAIWFVVLKNDDFENVALSRGVVAECKVIKIKTIPTIEAGELSFFEANHDVEFGIKRLYYISKVPEGARRGFHAHKKLKQILFCPYGKIQLILDNGNKREEITLNDPSIGIVIDKPTWREMLWLEKDSVLVVGASEYYNEDDYIRNYNEFLVYVNKER